MGKKVGFAAVFRDITRKKAVPREAKMTAIKVILKEIHEKEDKSWVIYTLS